MQIVRHRFLSQLFDSISLQSKSQEKTSEGNTDNEGDTWEFTIEITGDNELTVIEGNVVG